MSTSDLPEKRKEWKERLTDALHTALEKTKFVPDGHAERQETISFMVVQDEEGNPVITNPTHSSGRPWRVSPKDPNLLEEVGHSERQQIVFENYEWLRDVCSRLPLKYGIWWNGETNSWRWITEGEIEYEAHMRGTRKQLEEVLKERKRGKRLVAIVAHGGVLYEFV